MMTTYDLLRVYLLLLIDPLFTGSWEVELVVANRRVRDSAAMMSVFNIDLGQVPRASPEPNLAAAGADPTSSTRPHTVSCHSERLWPKGPADAPSGPASTLALGTVPKDL